MNRSKDSFRCYLIGADTLLAECAALLLEQGHEILGLITDAPRLSEWAESNQVDVVPASSDYAATLRSSEYEYLFSITHLQMISEEVLATPSVAAINFHDGPLPRYAGLNAPAWALMQGEEHYAITWHLMTAGADLGDVLEQSDFDISPGETSLSLNTQCFAMAIESFSVLIDRLAAGVLDGQPQDLSQRTYFGRHDRPDALGLLQWDRPAHELEALVRALDFGPYRNELGVARLKLGDKSFNVLSAVAEDCDAIHAPGKVLEIGRDALVVASAEGALRITGLTTATGEPILPMDALVGSNLEVGHQLPRSQEPALEAGRKNTKAISRSEAFWRNRLHAFEPIELPYINSDRGGGELLRKNIDLAKVGGRTECVASLCGWLSRIGGKSHFSVPLRGWVEIPSALYGIVSPHSVGSFEVDLDADFATNLQSISSELERLEKRAPWLLDLVSREPSLHAQGRLRGGELADLEIVVSEDFDSIEPARGVALVLVVDPGGQRGQLICDSARVSAGDATMMAAQISQFAQSRMLTPEKPLGRLDLLGQELRDQILAGWNSTDFEHPANPCIHEVFEARAREHPDRPAVVFEGRSISYVELDRAANALADRLISSGVMPNDLVGVFVERSLDLPLAVLGTLKAGAAYVPLDPGYPSERIALMIEDSGLRTVLATSSQAHNLPPVSGVEVIRVDRNRSERVEPPATQVRDSDLSYVIYTSGSTGRPKGVMIEHRNVINFFAGMDEVVEPSSEGVWFAVTSLSFDISVLELLWTLTRGFQVVVYLDRERSMGSGEGLSDTSARHVDFGLYYWGNDEGTGPQKYKLLMEGAKFADQNGFTAVWTPERHFHSFGGPYPNPAVTGSAVAAVTQNVEVRAGSCVIPLHHPIRVAEEWAVVDNLSNGRTALAIASGWQPNDFILSSGSPAENKTIMVEHVDALRRLWRGESVEFPDHEGKMVSVTTQPRPVQPEVSLWWTTAGNPESYRNAASQGANVLTHLLGQTLEEVGEKISIYRQALSEHGRDPEAFKVTLMLHTCVGEDPDVVKELVRAPMKDYLGGSVSLVKNFAWAFPAFKRPEGLDASADDIDLSSLSEDELEAILDHAFERYFETSGLFGTVDQCVEMIERCKAIGVDEIACLVDYGVPTEDMLVSLPLLKSVMVQSQANSARVAAEISERAGRSVSEQIEGHAVTHLQCTPSMARMLLTDEESKQSLDRLSHMLVGGEAFPAALAQELRGALSGRLTNMYGPTETTIWSSSHEVSGDGRPVPIGKPIANTQLYVLDERLEPLPPGVPGELYIGGDGVVRGYLHRPDLTSERFVDDPFSKTPGSRMYRTGDLAKWRRDGVMEFIGRTDHQVKIRGYRIELGEIETRLAEIDAVEECVVLVREDTPEDKRIVAYVVSASDLKSVELRDELRGHLPDHMVPQHIVQLTSLPLTPNGKIDRKALPAPDTIRSGPELVHVAPENELEGKIVALWQKVLGVNLVGTHDNFFDIGGHSLLVVKVHRELKTICDFPVSLTDLYRFPTIHSLVEHLTTENSGERMEESRDRGARRREAMAQRRRRRGSRS